MRASRLLAVARRDLSQELKGRQGWMLPAVIAALLLPLSVLPPLPGVPTPDAPAALQVTGDVPPEVAGHPRIEVVDPAVQPSARPIRLEREGGTLLVRGPVPGPLREALDGEAPALQIRHAPQPLHLPGRSLLFALISASTLTGPIAASIGGERSLKTLISLLTAAISRAEVVVGKWLAWSAVGVGSSLMAAILAIALGRLEAGWWILPMVTVPAATVALGLFLVRRATDVVGGTTVALRALPAALSIAGVVAYLLGMRSPWLGSLLPLGGALITAGDTWPGAGPALLATASNLAFCAVCLWATSRDLERPESRTEAASPLRLAAITVAVGAAAWWTAVAGPVLWASAGNPRISEGLDPAIGVLAGASALGLFTVAHRARLRPPTPSKPGLPTARTWLLAAGIGVVLALLGATGGLLPIPREPFLAQAHLRLQTAMTPGWAGLLPLGLTLVADELLFRGWLQRRAGPVAAVIAWIAVKSPLDPLFGLLSGGLLTALATRGGPGSTLLARGIWALAAGMMPPLGAASAVALGATVWGAMIWLRPRSPEPRAASA